MSSLSNGITNNPKAMNPNKAILITNYSLLCNDILLLEKALKKKANALDKELLKENENLFGDKDENPNILFQVKAEPTQRQIIVDQIKDQIICKEQELKRLKNQIENFEELNKNQLQIL